MQITYDHLHQLFGRTDPSKLRGYVDPLNQTMNHYGINNIDRIAMFIAQVGYESDNLSVTEENLNYSQMALQRLYCPSHFTAEETRAFAYKPEKIANRIYANRFGNGNEASGDGWKYRGRGLIQLTFKSNYNDYMASCGLTEIPLPPKISIFQWLESAQGAVDVAGWYWNKHHLNVPADEQSVAGATKLINGGLTIL